MNIQSFFSGTKAGTTGGTLTIILANINSADTFKTIVLAIIGASVSFFVSLLWKHIFRKRSD
jgi:mannitol-specific phosphotransferase system IIBC component